MENRTALPGRPPGRVDDAASGMSNPSDDSDAALLAGLVGGSDAAFAQLYDRHGGAVFAMATRSTGDRWVAAEVVQETFLALWNRAELFDATRGTLRSWLLTIARNRSVDHLRSAARHDRAALFSSFDRPAADDQPMAEWLTATGELIASAAPEPGPEVALIGKEESAVMRAALRSLTPTERCVVGLAYDEQLSQSEIADRLGWPLGTVKTRTRRALRRLREQIEGQARLAATAASAPCDAC